MGEVYRPPPPVHKPVCKHPSFPKAQDLPLKTRWYCESCKKVYVVTYDDAYGVDAPWSHQWERWPMTSGCWFGLVCGIIALLLIGFAIFMIGTA